MMSFVIITCSEGGERWWEKTGGELANGGHLRE